MNNQHKVPIALTTKLDPSLVLSELNINSPTGVAITDAIFKDNIIKQMRIITNEKLSND